MAPLPFAMLYAVCLAVCVGALELVRLGWVPPEPPEPPPVSVEQVIAVPPRPEGVRKVVGQGDEVYRYTEQGCREQEGQYRDICYHQLARQRAPTDLDGGLDACRLISEDEVSQECIADVAELYSPADRERSLAICPTIERKKWRDQCVFGISLALATIDPEWAFRNCDGAGQWRKFCRHDVNGEISVIDLDLALAHCGAEEGDLLQRKTCWHGIGKYIARVDVDRAFAACEQVPLGPQDLYRENCFHGLGWGASETAGIEFVRTCGRAAEKQDSCLLGVAYNLRRFDQAGAMTVCSQVARTDLAQQCEQFVSTGTIRRR